MPARLAEPPAAMDGVTQPRWAPFFLCLALLALIVSVPVALGIAAPARAEGAVGVYERVKFSDESGARPAIAGFIAPEGWLRTGDTEASEDPVEQAEFASPHDEAWLAAELRTAVDSPARLLRESAPLGALASPVKPFDAGNGLETRFIEYDLEAGAGVEQLFAVCNTSAEMSCLLFTVNDFDRVHTFGTVLPDVAAVLKTAEVFS